MAVTYILKTGNSDLTPFADGNRDMSVGTGTDTNFAVGPANGGGTQTHGFITLASKPNSDEWLDSGVYTVEIEIDSGDADITCDVRVGRVNSSGTILQTGSFIGTQAMDVSRTYSPVAPAWTNVEEACGNRLFVELLFTNNAAHGGHSISVGVGTTANEVITDLTEDSSGCAAGFSHSQGCIIG